MRRIPSDKSLRPTAKRVVAAKSCACLSATSCALTPKRNCPRGARGDVAATGGTRGRRGRRRDKTAWRAGIAEGPRTPSIHAAPGRGARPDRPARQPHPFAGGAVPRRRGKIDRPPAPDPSHPAGTLLPATFRRRSWYARHRVKWRSRPARWSSVRPVSRWCWLQHI